MSAFGRKSDITNPSRSPRQQRQHHDDGRLRGQGSREQWHWVQPVHPWKFCTTNCSSSGSGHKRGHSRQIILIYLYCLCQYSPLRRECRMFSAALYACVRFCSYNLHTRPRVQRASGIPCSILFEGQRNANLGQIVPRECERVFSV